MNRQHRRKCAAHRRYLDTMITEGGGKPHDAGTKFVVKLQIITKAGWLNALEDMRRKQQGRLECGTCNGNLAFADFDDVLIIRPYNDHATTEMFAPLCRACAARPRSDLTVAAAQAIFGKDIDVLPPKLPGTVPPFGEGVMGIETRKPAVTKAYFDEWKAGLGLAEPLDGESTWVASFHRIGT